MRGRRKKPGALQRAPGLGHGSPHIGRPDQGDVSAAGHGVGKWLDDLAEGVSEVGLEAPPTVWLRGVTEFEVTTKW